MGNLFYTKLSVVQWGRKYTSKEKSLWTLEPPQLVLGPEGNRFSSKEFPNLSPNSLIGLVHALYMFDNLYPSGHVIFCSLFKGLWSSFKCSSPAIIQTESWTWSFPPIYPIASLLSCTFQKGHIWVRGLVTQPAKNSASANWGGGCCCLS